MPLLSIVRFLASLVSLVFVGLVIYLGWSWYEGEPVRQVDGQVIRVREDWRLWLALALAAFSLVGKFIVVPLTARPDTGEPSREDRGSGQMLEQPDGARLYVEELGNPAGTTLIFTHGWAMDSTTWHYAKKDLEKRFRVVVWDLPGQGKSTGEISLESFAACLGALTQRFGPRKVVLVGHSIGGMTIQTLARDNPDLFRERVAGAVLINTTFTNPLRTMILPRLAQALRWPLLEPIMRLTILLQPLAWLSAWQSYLSGMAHLGNRLGFGKYVTHSQLNHVTLLSTKNHPGNIQKGNLAMFRWDATGAIGKTGVPVLILAGGSDIVTKPQASDELLRQVPSGALQVVEGGGHMGMMERADQYNAAIAAFADGLADAAPSTLPRV